MEKNCIKYRFGNFKILEKRENLMYVVGATKAEYFTEIRKIVPNSFLLVPGVGAQGGSLAEVCKYGMNENVLAC
jgi:orotidine-5'-phosphate decarboxylase